LPRNTPYGIQSAAQGINDFGVITGFGWSDPFAGPYTGFKLRKSSFTRFDFPGSQFTLPYSINNATDLAGLFIDPEGSFWGMVTIYGYPYQVFAAVFGNNDLGQIPKTEVTKGNENSVSFYALCLCALW